MSLQQWQDRFYCPSSSCKAEIILDTGLRLWRGLCPEILKKYGLGRCGQYIYESHSDTSFYITSSSHGLAHSNNVDFSQVDQAFHEWFTKGDLSDMIELIEKALKK